LVRVRVWSVVVVLVAGMLFAPASARGTPSPHGVRGATVHHEHVRSRVLVGVDGPVPSVRAAVRALGGHVLEYQPAGRLLVVRSPTDPPGWARAIRSTPGVRYAEPDYLLEPDDTFPNDPMLPSLWGLQAIRAPAAWDVSTGSPNVVVGVIDSGIDETHPDLAGRLWTNPGEIPGNGVDDEGDGWIDDVHGADCAANDGDPIDDDGHGTHVAGTIGAAGDDGIGVVGVNWNVRLMALDIFKANGTAAVSDITQCIDYAIAHGVRVANNSYGGIDFSQAEYDAFTRARNAGMLMVAAAGNTGWNVDVTPLFPAAFDLDNVVSVAASQQDDSLASWSCSGPGSVDIAAPGVGILSTWPTYLYAPGYWSMDGTSMAAPHVTGAAALLLSAVPHATFPFLRDVLLSTAHAVPALAGKVGSGGRLDVAAALAAATSSQGLSVRPPVPSFHGATTVTPTSANVDIRWSALDPVGIVSFELQRSTDGGLTYLPITLSPVTSMRWTQRASVNAPSYLFRARARDETGSTSGWATGAAFRLRYVQESSSTIAYQGAWTTTATTGALGGAVRSSSAGGATATASLDAGSQAVGLIFARSPGSGKAEVWIDGTRRATLDLYLASAQQRWLGFGTALDPSAPHTVVIKVLGQKRKASLGTAVALDALATLSP
jgi:subtilisin family serine protease